MHLPILELLVILFPIAICAFGLWLFTNVGNEFPEQADLPEVFDDIDIVEHENYWREDRY